LVWYRFRLVDSLDITKDNLFLEVVNLLVNY